jgi:FtsH-binding integral membrane protein
MQYELEHPYAAQAEASERATFIRRTYAHLAGAVLAFVAVEALLLNSVDHNAVLRFFLRGGSLGWLAIMLAFMAAGWIARTFAYSRTSQAVQYFGLGLYVVAEAVIFLPLMIIATHYVDKSVIPTAGILTLAVFGGLTIAVFLTRRDFSFLAPVLSVGMMIALGVIVAASFIQAITLGLIFSFAMVALISGYTLFYTSRVLLHYQTDQYVGAALELFACFATLLWYVLQIVMSVSSRD